MDGGVREVYPAIARRQDVDSGQEESEIVAFSCSSHGRLKWEMKRYERKGTGETKTMKQEKKRRVGKNEWK